MKPNNKFKLDHPKIYKKDCGLSMSRCFDLPNPGLRAYFERVRAGQPDEYRTPWYKDRPLHAIADNWFDQLESGLAKTWPSLLEYETDQKAKIGPMSVMKPLSERMDDIAAYYDCISLKSEPVSQDALSRTVEDFMDVVGLRLRSLDRTMANMKLSTNSGSPFFTKRKEVMFEGNLRCSRPGVSTTVTNRGSWFNTAVLGWRGQEGGPDVEDVKQRVVWMFPFEINVRELQLYQPLIEGAQHSEIVPAWVSNDCVDKYITKMFDSKSPKDDIVCTDFSKFDQHFNASMQGMAKWILEHLVTTTEIRNFVWLEEIFPIKYNIPLCYDWNQFRTGWHGMASGSGGTNVDETLAHRALQHQAALDAGVKLNPNSQCLGDDGILTFSGIDVKSVMRTYEKCGQEMNPDKQHVSKQDCIYLRRWHHLNYKIDGINVGVYPTMRALGRLAEQERFYDKWSPEMVALRQLSILENCKFHPMRDEFADYCMKGDKFKLGLELPGFFDKLVKHVKEAIDYMPDFLGYTRSIESRDPSSGINDWWIVNYLKSKR